MVGGIGAMEGIMVPMVSPLLVVFVAMGWSMLSGNHILICLL